jgi:DNA-binding CsgD family transcriptional regulator
LPQYANSLSLQDAICNCASFAEFASDIFPALAHEIGASSACLQQLEREPTGFRLSRWTALGLTRAANDFFLSRATDTFSPLLFRTMLPTLPVDTLHLTTSIGLRFPSVRELWAIGGVNEVLILRLLMPDDTSFVLGLHRQAGDTGFDARDQLQLRAMGPALRSTLRRLQLEERLTPAAAGTGHQASPLAVLTPRQRELATQVALGLSNKVIARERDISPYTVENHLRAIYRKLRVGNRTQLAALCSEAPSTPVPGGRAEARHALA